LLNPGKGIFDYSIENKISVGKLVYVPLKNNFFYGVVIGKGSNSLDSKKLKPATVLENIPSLSIEILEFCNWLSEWCMQDNSLVTRLVVPSLDYLKPIKNKYVLYVNKTKTDEMSKLGLETYKYIKENPYLSLADYCKILNVSRSVINNLIKNKNILIKEIASNNLDDDIAVN
jgi:Primosomal protein N'' (replication factor Y) - superfamily II helicase